MAEDKGTPVLESTPFMVAVNVLDENDNDPLFTKSRYDQNITENLPAGFLSRRLRQLMLILALMDE